MILLIVLTIFAMLVLAFGFLDIKIPFVSVKKESKSKEQPAFKQPINISDKLVKDSVEHTIRSIKFLKEKVKENVLIEEAE